ncbi:MAG: DNA gyrase inhibitor YacG [Candidatus Thiodiazotropha taylori]|nr:DNA gyrase inhibitor YacG [Candidatus Thiodiazotropha taylori]MCG8099151.1 DNA gyrase inhibitor YacG [Candidatus Thiodiazotropha taylori]MCW4292091.1 DNA gyrase inhibitor YacG [Candidatus Thiodiazotropha taylori]
MEKTAPTTVPCPNCGKPVLWQESSKWKPFCSERCRLIDLGDWLDENHKISEPINGQFEEEPFD